MPDDIAEAVAPGAEHAHRPARLGCHIEDIRQGQLGRRRQAVDQILVPLAEDLQVQGQHQRIHTGGLGALDQSLDEAAVTHHIQLEPERLADMLGDVFQGTDAHGRQGVAQAECGGGAGGENLAIGVLHAGQAGGCQGHRHGHVLADHGGADRALIDIARHPLAEFDPGKIAFVGPVGALSPGTRIGVIVEHPWHTFLRQLA